jgi:hypothetical protein
LIKPLARAKAGGEGGIRTLMLKSTDKYGLLLALSKSRLYHFFVPRKRKPDADATGLILQLRVGNLLFELIG